MTRWRVRQGPVFGRDVCWVDAPPAEVAARVDALLLAGSHGGEMEDLRFRLVQRLPTRNSWRPLLEGSLRGVAGGTLVSSEARLGPWMWVFTLLIGAGTLGLGWLMGFVVFHLELKGALSALHTALGDVSHDLGALSARQQAADPSERGAEARPPWSLPAHTTLEATQFTLHSGAPWWRHTTRVTVGGQGLLLSGAVEASVPWPDLEGASVSAGALGLHAGGAQLELPASDHPQADLRWLAHYIEAQAARRQGPPDAALG